MSKQPTHLAILAMAAACAMAADGPIPSGIPGHRAYGSDSDGAEPPPRADDATIEAIRAERKRRKAENFERQKKAR